MEDRLNWERLFILNPCHISRYHICCWAYLNYTKLIQRCFLFSPPLCLWSEMFMEWFSWEFGCADPRPEVDASGSFRHQYWAVRAGWYSQQEQHHHKSLFSADNTEQLRRLSRIKQCNQDTSMQKSLCNFHTDITENKNHADIVQLILHWLYYIYFYLRNITFLFSFVDFICWDQHCITYYYYEIFFRPASGLSLGMAMSVGWSVHHLGPDWNSVCQLSQLS